MWRRVVAISLIIGASSISAQDQQVLFPMSRAPPENEITFRLTWDLLGPFQIGTREFQWGADPLEYYGGFQSLQYDPNAAFASSLAHNGTVRWSRTACDVEVGDDGQVIAHIDAGFPSIDWAGLRASYGWAALQYQAWVRSTFHVASSSQRTFGLEAPNIIEFRLDDQHYFGGDFYGLRRAPLVLRLDPGPHKIEVRLIRDLRAHGDTGDPSVRASVELTLVHDGLEVVPGSAIVPDVTGPCLASRLGSLALTNTYEYPIQILSVLSRTPAIDVSLAGSEPPKIVAGQTRSITFDMYLKSNFDSPSQVSLEVKYRCRQGRVHLLQTALLLRNRDASDPHKITYLHPGEMVSYAILRPPSKKAIQQHADARQLPVMLNLHGAGLEADSDAVSRSLDAIADIPAWTLFPTGVTPWSGDDWHQWGWSDVESAIAAIPEWIQASVWEGPGVDTSRWLVTGHSNGGQGVWYALAHRPDNVIAAAPASGYMSILSYVPYTFWQETEASKMAIVFSAMNSYRSDLIVPYNAQHIPTAVQHGSDDDNVPTYHSRRMHQLLSGNESTTQYLEFAGKGHWFDGIMTTPFLKEFYYKHVANKSHNEHPPGQFQVVCANPSVTGPKFGVRVETVITPGRMGKVEAMRAGDSFTFKTSNVRRLTLQSSIYQLPVIVDGQSVPASEHPADSNISLFLDFQGLWSVHSHHDLSACTYNTGLGGLDAILRTQGRFRIVSSHPDVGDVAMQISRNLMQYFYADAEVVPNMSEVVPNMSEATADSGNVITIGIGKYVDAGSCQNHPVQIEANKIVINDGGGGQRQYNADEDGLGAVYLRPQHGGKLELVVWGTDSSTLAVAARLLPLMTGGGQPDFIVLNKQMLWRGVGGALALGFFDADWKVSSATSFFT